MAFGLFKSRSEIVKEKVIFSQKSRISSLEHDLDELKRKLGEKEDDHRKDRTNFERSKERLVDQIIGLSDKFADINQRMLDIANENARLKVLTRDNKESLIMKSAPKKQEDSAKEEIGKAVSSVKSQKGKKASRKRK